MARSGLLKQRQTESPRENKEAIVRGTFSGRADTEREGCEKEGQNFRSWEWNCHEALAAVFDDVGHRQRGSAAGSESEGAASQH
jgi:hypothetical protein